MAELEKRDRLQQRRAAMVTDQSTFISHYKDLAQFIMPRRGRFDREDVNKGDRRWNQIINGAATKAHSVAQAGLFNGIMSPTQQWFALATEDPDLRDFQPVRTWLHEVRELLLTMFARSNLYISAPTMLGADLLFGTGCVAHMEDIRQVARFFPMATGSYQLAQNERLEVDTFTSETMMSVEQIVRKFSRSRDRVSDNISEVVRTQYDRGNYESRYPVVHFVLPNAGRSFSSERAEDKPFASYYYELGRPRGEDKFLRVSGFDEFPFYCPRWEVTGEDTYGTNCPGMVALGDVHQLQFQERRKAQGLDKIVDPPMQGPPSLRNVPIQNVPNGVTIFDAGGGQQKLTPLFDIRLPLGELVQDMDRVEARINEAFHRDLWQAISTMEGVQPRNQLELMQRHQERLMQLGPMLTRTHHEFLDPLITRSFNQMARLGVLPPAPAELEEQVLQVHYVSSLAVAQQAAQTGTIDRLAAYVSTLGQIWPGAAEKFDAEQSVDEYARLIGAPPSLVVSDEVVQQRRQERQQQEQLVQGSQVARDLGQAAQSAGNINLGDGETVAGRLLNQRGQ